MGDLGSMLPQPTSSTPSQTKRTSRPYDARRVPSRPTSSLRRALLASLACDPPLNEGRPTVIPPAEQDLQSLLAGCDENELVTLAVSEGVAATMSKRLASVLSGPQRSRLSGHVRREVLSHMAFLGWLDKCGRALDEAEIDWAVLKGPALVEISYRGAPRSYTDLDLLVAPRQLKDAIAALLAIGAVLPVDWAPLIKEAKGELSLFFDGLPLVDLHWHPVFHRSARERFMISTDELLQRRRRVRLGGVNAWVLEPVDFAVHIALHASFQGAQRLRRLVDIERTVVNQAPNWGTFIERCQSWRVTLPVGVLLNAAHQTLGAPVPESVVRHLTGRWVGHLLANHLGQWVPTGPLPGGRSFANGLSRSLRDTWPATFTQFARESWGTVRTLARPAPPRCERSLPLDLSTDASGLEAYLDMVRRADCYGHLLGR
jgi:hypothetical protein